MALEKELIRRVVVLGACAAIGAVAADDNNVAVIDLKTFEVTGSFTTGIDPDRMAWTKLQ